MVLVFVFLYAPIAVLIVFSFNSTKSRTVWSGFTTKWYAELFHDSQILSSLSTTLTVSVLAAVIATVVGTCAAIGFFNMRRRWRTPLMTINNIPMMNAAIVTGVSLCLLFVFGGGLLRYELGFGTLLIAHITFNVPYVILSVMPKLRQLDDNVAEAALDLGATPWKALTKVIIPQIYPAILTGALLAFSMSLDDFVVSYFNAGPGINTISMYVESMKRYNLSVNAMATLFVVVVALILLLTNLVPIIKDKKAQKEEPQNV